MKIHTMALTFVALILAISVPAQDAVKSAEGERKISMKDCREIKVYGSWIVDVVPQKSSDCVIKGNESVLEKVRIQQKNGIILIQEKGGTGTIMIPLEMLPEQNRFTGASKIRIQGVLEKNTRWTLTKGASLEIDKIAANSFTLSGFDTTSLTIKDGELSQLSIRITRDAKADVNGNFKILELRMSGAAKATVKTCEDAKVWAKNTAMATVTCTKTLQAISAGDAQILYSGTPSVTKKTSGSGVVLKR